MVLLSSQASPMWLMSRQSLDQTPSCRITLSGSMDV